MVMMFADGKTDILGVKLNRITKSEAISKVKRFLVSNKNHYIVTVNPEFVVLAQTDEEFKHVLNQADLSVPDGVGLLMAARYLNKVRKNIFLNIWNLVKTGTTLIFYSKYCHTILPERITGADLLLDIAKIAEENDYSVGFIVPDDGLSSVEDIKQGFLKKHPNLKISGYLAKRENNFQTENSCFQQDILFVGLGFPDQEKWIYNNILNETRVKLAVGIGGSLDFISGRIKRAPKFLRAMGLEWLWRFLLKPKKYKRIWTATCVFTKLLLKNENF